MTGATDDIKLSRDVPQVGQSDTLVAKDPDNLQSEAPTHDENADTTDERTMFLTVPSFIDTLVITKKGRKVTITI